MPINAALAAVAVADLDEAKTFYTTVFGRPADTEPMPTLAQWDIDGGGGFQVVTDPALAGSSMATLLVTEFDTVRESLQEAGVAAGDTVDGVISRLFQIEDPAGTSSPSPTQQAADDRVARRVVRSDCPGRGVVDATGRAGSAAAGQMATTSVPSGR